MLPLLMQLLYGYCRTCSCTSTACACSTMQNCLHTRSAISCSGYVAKWRGPPQLGACTFRVFSGIHLTLWDHLHIRSADSRSGRMAEQHPPPLQVLPQLRAWVFCHQGPRRHVHARQCRTTYTPIAPPSTHNATFTVCECHTLTQHPCISPHVHCL